MVTAQWSELLAPPRVLNHARPWPAESTCGFAEDFQPLPSGTIFIQAPAPFLKSTCHLSPKKAEALGVAWE